jgi:ribosome biogenesis GTPase / thiamine phosphate phosphatase
VRLDRDQVVDELGPRHGVVERDAHQIVARTAGADTDGRAGARERGDEVAPNGRIGIDHGSNNDHAARILRMTDAQVRRAIVIAVGRNAAWTVLDGTRDAMLAVLRKNDRRTVLAPGDIVETSRLDAERVVIENVLTRTSALVRRTSAGRTKTMAANIDLIAIVAALADPPPSFALVDQLVAFSVQHGVAPSLFLTKPDLVPAGAAAEIAAIYTPLDVPTLTVAPRTGDGIPALREFLAGRHALLVGNSGVGKSSIFRALGGTASVGEVSAAGRGRQTTTSARLFQSAGGFLIDSPGIGEFTLDPVPPSRLAGLFLEFREPATRCRFDDCRHLVEPDCAVREAVDEGRIAASRYTSYRQIALAPVAS